MQFEIKNVTRSQNDLMRVIGYRPAFFQNESEVSIIRPIGGKDYPRFHLYIKAIFEEQGAYSFNLHLDQKKPSYQGSTGHSGEYDGPLLVEEAGRIKNLLNNA